MKQVLEIFLRLYMCALKKCKCFFLRQAFSYYIELLAGEVS